MVEYFCNVIDYNIVNILHKTFLLLTKNILLGRTEYNYLNFVKKRQQNTSELFSLKNAHENETKRMITSMHFLWPFGQKT